MRFDAFRFRHRFFGEFAFHARRDLLRKFSVLSEHGPSRVQHVHLAMRVARGRGVSPRHAFHWVDALLAVPRAVRVLLFSLRHVPLRQLHIPVGLYALGVFVEFKKSAEARVFVLDLRTGHIVVADVYPRYFHHELGAVVADVGAHGLLPLRVWCGDVGVGFVLPRFPAHGELFEHTLLLKDRFGPFRGSHAGESVGSLNCFSNCCVSRKSAVFK